MLIVILLVLILLSGCATPAPVKELASLEKEYFKKLSERLEGQRKGNIEDPINRLKSTAVEDYMEIINIWSKTLEKEKIANKYREATGSKPSRVKEYLMKLSEVDFKYIFDGGEEKEKKIIEDYNQLLELHGQMIKLSSKLASNSSTFEGQLQAGTQIDMKDVPILELIEFPEILSKDKK